MAKLLLMERLIYINGNTVKSNSKTGKVLTSSLLFGSSLFETIRIYNRFPFKLDKHIERLNTSAKKIGVDLNLSTFQLEKIISELIKKNEILNSRLRIWVGFDMHFYLNPEKSKNNFVLVVDTQPVDIPKNVLYKNGVKLQVYKYPRAVESIIYGIKTTSYMENLWAKRTAKLNRFFDAIFVNNNGDITESTTSNIFFVFNQEVRTPQLNCGVLPGVTRDVVIEILKKQNIKFSESRIKIEDVKKANESFTTSSIVEVMPVVQIDNIKIGNGKPGKITKLIMIEFKKFVEVEYKKWLNK